MLRSGSVVKAKLKQDAFKVAHQLIDQHDPCLIMSRDKREQILMSISQHEWVNDDARIVACRLVRGHTKKVLSLLKEGAEQTEVIHKC